MGSVLEGVALVFSGGAPTGAAPPSLAAFVNGRFLGLPPIVWFLVVFVVAATLLLDLSGFGRRLQRDRLQRMGRAALRRADRARSSSLAYVLSGFCAALVGLLLAGFTAQAYYDMGKPYLLASIAVVVLGGTSITGGRGHYIGILGGALLFTALSSMLASTSLPEAVRSIIYGLVLLGAVGDAARETDQLIEAMGEGAMTAKDIQVCINPHFDAVALWIGSFGGEDSPCDISRGVFGAKRGVPRLIDFFKRYGIITTWGVTGHSMESFPRAAEMIIEAGHEIGIHGYTHENPLAMSREQESEVLDRTFDVIKRMSGKAPVGYMAPWWELSPNTVELLLARGIKYDSSA